jgi:ABC-type multidrug transport system ATPase subunit
MFQSPILPGEVSVDTAIGQATHADRNLESKTKELLNSIGLGRHSRIAECSFGQRRLVEFCITVSAPKIALLDEPFSGLSSTLRMDARALLAQASRTGLTSLVVDHLHQDHDGSYRLKHTWVPAATPPMPPNNHINPVQILKEETKFWPEPCDIEWDVPQLSTPDSTVLASVSLKLQAGSAMVVLGGNGAGKSTVLRALAGVGQPWGSARESLSRVGNYYAGFLSPQPPKLASQLSVADNLRCMLWEPQTKGRRALQTAWSLLRWLGFAVDDRSASPAGELSGGEAAMVAVVGAVVSGKRLLLLDEPFEGMSAPVMRRVVQLLQCALLLKKNIILSTHEFPSWVLLPSASTLRLISGSLVSGSFTGGELALESPEGRDTL